MKLDNVSAIIEFAAPLVVVRFPPEERAPNGKLIDPPRLYALRFNREEDRLECHEVSFAGAEALAPQAFANAQSVLWESRKAKE